MQKYVIQCRNEEPVQMNITLDFQINLDDYNANIIKLKLDYY